ncbi:hypothetical protein SAMN05444339_10260 [Loktanella atrilutea]|uniref:Uncharacterized protein n=1 Tax=Loktanella atrilutea TaxID=366533 RepID=A0A1M4WC16_LOKAT|nr:hypothetical protein [Loktanella atrilutea]SHE78690.1 hypothetical protein SAMN05444339_10260 [Loktanella atrilutea]
MTTTDNAAPKLDPMPRRDMELPPSIGEAALIAENARLLTERDEAYRRRDAWRAKAEGYDDVRLALREKVGAPWPPNLSRLMWAGLAADEKKRADDAGAENTRLRNLLFDVEAVLIGPSDEYDGCAEVLAKVRAALSEWRE